MFSRCLFRRILCLLILIFVGFYEYNLMKEKLKKNPSNTALSYLAHIISFTLYTINELNKCELYLNFSKQDVSWSQASYL